MAGSRGQIPTKGTLMELPKVVTCNIVSVDGRLTIAPGIQLLFGDERWTAIAGNADPYEWMRELHDPEVMLEGSGSFVMPDAEPIIYPAFDGDAAFLFEHYLPDRIVEVPDRHWFTVVDGRGRVQLQFTEWPDPEWAGWHALVLTSRAAAPAHLAWLRDSGIPYLVVGEGPVDLHEALRLLRSELGATTVVSTGGGRLGGALLRADLVDEIDLVVLPAAIGGRGTPALFDADPLGVSETPTPLQLHSHEVDDAGHLRLRYSVKR